MRRVLIATIACLGLVQTAGAQPPAAPEDAPIPSEVRPSTPVKSVPREVRPPQASFYRYTEYPLPPGPITRDGVRFYFGKDRGPETARPLTKVAVTPVAAPNPPGTRYCTGSLEAALSNLAREVRKAGGVAVARVISDPDDSLGGSTTSYLCDTGAVALSGVALAAEVSSTGR